jgi:hypothetical protein
MSSFGHKLFKNLNEVIEKIKPTSADSPLVFKPVFLTNLALLVSFTVRNVPDRACLLVRILRYLVRKTIFKMKRSSILGI